MEASGLKSRPPHKFMPKWFTGHGYGISSLTDVTGRPLLTYQGPDDSKPFLLADRVAQTFDFTIKQKLTAGAATNGRMNSAVASAAKKILGGGVDDELDHKISLELGGANTPANLWLQHGITAGPSGSSDTLENNLALDVVNGKISLLDAWRIVSDQKGFLLAEDMFGAPAFDVRTMFSELAGNLADYITGKKKESVGTQDPVLKAKIDRLTRDLAKNPLNQKTTEAIIQTQVDMTQKQLGVSTSEAGQAVKMTLGVYTQSKGVDPREVIAATNLNIQRIIQNSKDSPNVFGVSTITIAKIMTAASIIFTGVGIVAFFIALIGVIIAGPEAIAGALSGGLFESIGGLIGVSPLAALGFGTAAFTEATAALIFIIGQGIKNVYDVGYLLPTQNITAMKDALTIQKGLAGFLPSAQNPAAGITGKTPKAKKIKATTQVYRIKAPNGKTYIFKTATDLANFKKAAGL